MDRSEKLLLGVTALLLLVGAGIYAARDGSRPPAGPPPLGSGTLGLVDRLDAFVQSRFQTVKEDFGMRRIVTIEEMLPHKAWNTDPEARAFTAALERSGTAVYFRTVALKRGAASWGAPVNAYEATTRAGSTIRFGSRDLADQAMKSHPGEYHSLRKLSPSQFHPSLSPALRIADTLKRNDSVPDLPRLRRGIDDAALAVQSTASHTFQAGDWQVVARPVRAGQAACLACHQDAGGQPARLNDPLGLALYLVRESKRDAAGRPQARYTAMAPMKGP